MYHGRTILTLLSFILSINRQCLLEPLSASAQFDALTSKGKYHSAGSFFSTGTDSCGIHAEYLSEQDTVVYNGNALLFLNRSINSGSYEWYINGLFASSGTDFLYYPSIGVNEIMLIASNGMCRDSAYSFVIWDGNQSDQHNNFQKQYNPSGMAMEPFRMASDRSRGYLIAGDYYLPGNNLKAKTTSLFHINEKGCVDWARSMEEGKEEVIQSIITTSDSGFLVSAFPFQSPQDNYPTSLNVFKLDKSGNIEWAHSFSNGTNVNNYFSAICETSDGGFALEIGSFPLSGNPSFISVIKIDHLGRFIWGRELSMQDYSIYNIGGILEKGNFIYATGSIYESTPPFDILRSFLMQIDATTGQVIWTKKNDPSQTPLTFTDIHNYKDSLLINSYSQNLLNDLIFLDNDGNYGSSILVNNPYGALSGKESILVAPDNGIYFHQPSGSIPGSSQKDIIMRIRSDKQIAWQYDFSAPVLNSSGWYQLSSAPDNGVSAIGSGVVPNGFEALTFLKMDSLGTGCNAGMSGLQVEANQVSILPMAWVINASFSSGVIDLPITLKEMPMGSRLLCPRYLNGCDLLKLEGPGRVCQPGDTAEYTLHYDPFCADSVTWAYDPKSIRVLSASPSYMKVSFTESGDFVIRVHKNGCNNIEDSIIISVGDNIPKINLPKDTTVCFGQVMKLDAGNGYASYIWQNGSGNQIMDVVDSGIYWVRLTDKSGCTYIDSVRVGPVKPLPMSFLPADTIICSGETLALKPSQSFRAYKWSTGDTSNSLKISSPGTYSLQVVDSFGCTGSDTIKVETKKCPSGIFFSNAFTPNKDGHNDIFKPQMFSSPVIYQLIIYNRWGQLVFESNDPGAGWDGRMGSIDQGSGAYVWVCTYQFAGEKKRVANGTVMLLR